MRRQAHSQCITQLEDVQGFARGGHHVGDQACRAAIVGPTYHGGIQDYLARLDANPSYWSKCTDPGNNPSLGNPGQLNWTDVPGATSQFAIELLPTSGYAQCVVGDQASFVNSASEFRLRATGRARDGSPVKRTIIATFRPKGFLTPRNRTPPG